MFQYIILKQFSKLAPTKLKMAVNAVSSPAQLSLSCPPSMDLELLAPKASAPGALQSHMKHVQVGDVGALCASPFSIVLEDVGLHFGIILAHSGTAFRRVE